MKDSKDFVFLAKSNIWFQTLKKTYKKPDQIVLLPYNTLISI